MSNSSRQQAAHKVILYILIFCTFHALRIYIYIYLWKKAKSWHPSVYNRCHEHQMTAIMKWRIEQKMKDDWEEKEREKKSYGFCDTIQYAIFCECTTKASTAAAAVAAMMTTHAVYNWHTHTQIHNNAKSWYHIMHSLHTGLQLSAVMMRLHKDEEEEAMCAFEKIKIHIYSAIIHSPICS